MAVSNINKRTILYWRKITKYLGVAYRYLTKHPHEYLTKHSKRYQRWHDFRFSKHIHTAVVTLAAFIGLSLVTTAVHQAYALSTWTQSDWSGGVGTSTTNQYSSETNLTTTTPNQITMPNALTFSGNEITDATRTTNTQGDGVTPPDNSTGVWESTTNLIKNGGFESNTSNWSESIGSGGAGSMTRITSDSKFGSASADFSITNTTAFNVFLNQYYSYNTAPYFNTSDQYTLSFWAKWIGGATTWHVGIQDSSATNAVMSLVNFTPTSTWQRFTFTFTPLQTGNQPDIYFGANPLAISEIHVDGVQLEQKGYATPYVDTNSSTASRGAARVQAPTNDINTTQGWMAERVRMDVSSSADANQTLGYIAIDSNDRLILRTGSGGTWQIFSWVSGVDVGSTSVTSSYSVGTIVTAVYYWTSTTLNISINGSAFTSVSRGALQSGNVTDFDIDSQGTTGDWLDGDTFWTAAGTGTLSNADASTLNALGSTDPTFSGLQALDSGTASPTMLWDGNNTTYASTGTLTSAIFNGGLPENWGTLNYTANVPTGTSVSVYVRGGSQSNLSDAPAWSSCSPISSGSSAASSCLPNKAQYAQYEVVLTSSNTAVPTLTNFSLSYSPSDTTPPTVNASSLAMYRGSGGASVASNGWINGNPYFSWTAGQDNTGGSGILGYCLYLGQSSSGDPITSEGDLGTSPINTNGACPYAVSSTDLDTSLAGVMNTALTTSNSPYYLNIKAIDNADNVYSGSSAQFEFYYDNTQPVNPAFITAPSEFVSNPAVTLTWPTTGSDAASDANSGVAGLQYRIGSSGTWYGVNQNGNQDMSDLLPNTGSYTTTGVDLTNLQQGDNIVYFRTWDNAGNVSTAYVTTVIKYNSTAPSSPQNLIATPTTNTTNSFAFSWLAPASFDGSASNITYCYTVNVLPTSTNCTYTAAGVTSVNAGAYATEPGDNTFYVVAKDEAGNINYATAASTTFTANTPAPGVPLSLDIADISTKATSTWKLALSWNQPSTVGAGIATYKVFRSTDGVNFTDIASTAGTSYVDSNLTQQTYYYEIQACDSANNCGALTAAVSDFPTGKFTSPANLISGPSVVATTRTATITWTTDRNSDSSVEYGLSSGHYFTTEAANTDQVTSHSVELNSLTAGTTYYYRVQWTDTDGNIGTSLEEEFTTLPAPTVSNVSTGNINLTTATIQFTSSNATAVQLQYGASGLTDTQTLNTSTNTSTYSIPLTGLDPGTTYTFRLNLYDTSDNLYNNPTTFSFATPPQPQITNIQFEPIPGALTGTEQVSWTTNVPATSDITYGQPGQTQQEAIDSTFVTNHSMVISNMPYNTPYDLVARSTDELGNTAVSDQQVFHTGVDTRPPIISDITIQPSIRGTGASAQGQLVISWKTDKAGTSQIAYGEGSSGNYSAKTAEDTALVTNHVVVVSNLSTSEVYHLQVLSKDANGVRGVSSDQTTIIGQASDSALSIVFNALQAIFGL